MGRLPCSGGVRVTHQTKKEKKKRIYVCIILSQGVEVLRGLRCQIRAVIVKELVLLLPWDSINSRRTRGYGLDESRNAK